MGLRRLFLHGEAEVLSLFSNESLSFKSMLSVSCGMWPNSVMKKIESRISAFVFQGRPERLKLSEIENSPENGGLGLTCIATKAESLLLRQALCVLSGPDETSSRHIGF